MENESSGTTVVVEFVRATSGSDGRPTVSRRHGVVGRAHLVDVKELELMGNAPGGDLKWLVKLVPALLFAMAPGH